MYECFIKYTYVTANSRQIYPNNLRKYRVTCITFIVVETRVQNQF